MDDSLSSLPVVGGFRFAGVAAGIKKTGALDLGLIVADAPVATAAVFTRNLVRAAPVELAAARVRGGKAQAVLVNSGNANACTGVPGERAARDTTARLAGALGIPDARVLPASTGVIGVLLPTEKVTDAMPALVSALRPDGAADFARAILTTDRWPKVAHRTVSLGRTTATVLGVAKGAGMIHPNMATTLGFVVTDAKVAGRFLRGALRSAVDATFNSLSVDGDTSTNDTIVAMASGAAGGATLEGEGRASSAFARALTEVLDELGRRIVADGEGAEHLVRIEVTGAPSASAATKVARTIATSQLVKTAIHGEDPNWGRIMAAAGRAGVRFDPARASVRIGEVVVFAKGLPVAEPAIEQAASRVMAQPEFTIAVHLGAGKGAAHYHTCDLGHEYVRINADYRS